MITNSIRRVLGSSKPLMKNKSEAQEEIFQRYLSRAQAHPQDPQAVFNLGMAYYVQGRWEEAESQFQGAVSLMPDHTDSRFYLGILWADRGWKEKAVQELEWVSQNSSNQILRRIAQRKIQQLRGES